MALLILWLCCFFLLFSIFLFLYHGSKISKSSLNSPTSYLYTKLVQQPWQISHLQAKPTAMQVACTGDMAGVSWKTTTDSNGAYLVVMIPQSNLALPVNAITSNRRMYIQTPLANCNMSVVSNLELVRTFTMGLILRIGYMVATNYTPQP